ncbi:MAG: hypothetical protein Q9191_004696 [Dirinaria sp. TL-2023a]
MAGPFSEYRIDNSTYTDNEEPNQPKVKEEDYDEVDPRIGKFICGECGRCYKTVRNLSVHFFSKHTEDYRNCQHCQPRRKCSQHRSTIKGWKLSAFRCKACYRNFKTEAEFNEHKYRFHRGLAEIKKQFKKLPQETQDSLTAQQASLFRRARERRAIVSSHTENEHSTIAVMNMAAASPFSSQPAPVESITSEQPNPAIEITADGRINIHGVPNADVSNKPDILQAFNKLSLDRDHRMTLDFILQQETPTHTGQHQVMSIGFVLQDGPASEKEMLGEGIADDYPELAALDECERYPCAATAHTPSAATTNVGLAPLIQHVLRAQDFAGFISMEEIVEILIYLLPQEQLLQVMTAIRPAAIPDLALTSDLTEVIQSWAYLKLLACKLSGKNHIKRAPVRYVACTILHHCFTLEDIVARQSKDFGAQYASAGP